MTPHNKRSFRTATVALTLAATLLHAGLDAPLVLVREAAAQPKAKPKSVKDELSGGALTAWNDGLLLLQQKTPDYGKALIKFREAYALSKNPRVLFNVAVCEKNLDQYARAAATLKQELAEGAGKIAASEVEEIKAAIAALERYVAPLEITVNEPDATISIDGNKVGTSPLTGPLTVDIGTRTVKIEKAGFEDATRQITVTGGSPAKEAFVIEPREKKTRVTVSVTGAPGATVKMDGIDMGPAPFTGDVPPGRHTFVAEARGYVTATQTSEVKFKEPLSISLSLAPKREEGRLRLEAAPAGAIIEIDGKVVGSGTWDGTLKSGAHQVVVRKARYQTSSLELTVADDAVLTRKVTLLEVPNNDWVAWLIGSAAIVGGGAVASYFLFKPDDELPIPGSLRKTEGEPVPATFIFGAPMRGPHR